VHAVEPLLPPHRSARTASRLPTKRPRPSAWAAQTACSPSGCPARRARTQSRHPLWPAATQSQARAHRHGQGHVQAMHRPHSHGLFHGPRSHGLQMIAEVTSCGARRLQEKESTRRPLQVRMGSDMQQPCKYKLSHMHAPPCTCGIRHMCPPCNRLLCNAPWPP